MTKKSPQPTLRRRTLTALVAIIALATVCAAAAALWLWLDPARLAQAGPARLLALLGLFILPAATVVFQTLDDRAQAETTTADEDHNETTLPPARRHTPRAKRTPKTHAHRVAPIKNR